ncbi:21399_t:CDS:2, partial [Dentiscutata erythropus]
KNDAKMRTTHPIRGKSIPSQTGGKSRFMMESYYQNFMKLSQNEEFIESSDFSDSNESNYASDFYDSNESNQTSDFHKSDESNEIFDSDDSNETLDFHDSGTVVTDISDDESEETFNHLGGKKILKDFLNTRKDDKRPFNETNDWELPLLGSSPIYEYAQNAHIQFYEISTPSTDVESYFNLKSDFILNDNKIVKARTKKVILDDSSDLSTEDEEETTVMSSD